MVGLYHVSLLMRLPLSARFAHTSTLLIFFPGSVFSDKAAIPLMIIILALATLRLIFIDGRDGFEQGPCRGVIETCFLRSGQRRCHLLDVEQRKQQATLDERDAVETLEGGIRLAGKRDERCLAQLLRWLAATQNVFDLSIEPTGKLPVPVLPADVGVLKLRR